MRAFEEIQRLQQKMERGDLPPDEPLFVLRARDRFAPEIVRLWALRVGRHYNPPPKKEMTEALALAQAMDDWPIKQVPGRPETRVTVEAAYRED